jgi:hypothetical protein
MIRHLFRSSRIPRGAGESQKESTESDFEKSPIRFPYEAMLGEYHALREEITARIQKQQEITSFALALVGGFIAITQLFNDALPPFRELLAPHTFYPIISLVFSAFTLMTLDHEMNIAHLFNYIDLCLRPRMNELLKQVLQPGVAMWQWNQTRARWQQHAGLASIFPSSLAVSKYVVTIVPNLLLLVSFWLVDERAEINIIQLALYGVSTATILWVLATAWYTSRIYLRMGRDHDS